MSLRDELKKLIAVERDRLARRDAKRAEVAANEAARKRQQCEIFAPALKALSEMRDALEPADGVEIILLDTCALVRLGTNSDPELRQELEISTRYTSWSGPMHCDDDGFIVRSMISDFPPEDIDDVARPDRKDFASADELIEWLSQMIARVVAFHRHIAAVRTAG